MNPRAKKVNYESPYTLIVEFTNNETRVFNVQPYLQYPIYESLKDEEFVSKAFINDGIVCWNDEIDIDPDTLYLESRALSLQD